MKSPFRFFAAGLVIVFGLLIPAISQAGQVYGVTFVGNDLISIDTTTGVGTLVGSLGDTVSPFGLAGIGTSFYTFDSTNDSIRQIDPSTGATQAMINVGLGPVLGQGGLAFQNNSVGFLTSALNPVTLDPENNLFRFDISSGTSARVGSTSVAIEALAFEQTGTLFGLGKLDGNLYTINPLNATTTLVGSTGVDVGSPLGSLAFSPDGTLFATLDDKLYTLNKTSGVASPVGSSDPSDDTGFSSISGLAFAPVPEPATFASALLAGAIGIVALRYRSRLTR